MSRRIQVCASSNPQRITQLVHSREPLGPPWVNQLDQVDRVQVVHPGKLQASEDCTLGSVSLIEQTDFDGPHGCLHSVADPKPGTDALNVSLDGAHADEEVPSDLLVGLSLHHLPEDLDFSRRKRVGRM